MDKGYSAHSLGSLGVKKPLCSLKTCPVYPGSREWFHGGGAGFVAVLADLWVIRLWIEPCFIPISLLSCKIKASVQHSCRPLEDFPRYGIRVCLKSICMWLFHVLIYLILTTEPTVGPRCVARKRCPVATAEAHASTRTFLWEKQNQPVQRKSQFAPPSLCHPVFFMTLPAVVDVLLLPKVI